jgi:hypothetical protein
MKEGACREDPDRMFPGTLAAEIEYAKRFCDRCPVIQQCGEWALATREPFGVWGGMSEAQRRNLLRQRGRGKGRGPKQAAPVKTPRKPAECGSRGGYQKHLRDKTEICAPCRRANTDADNRLRRTGTTKALV